MNQGLQDPENLSQEQLEILDFIKRTRDQKPIAIWAMLLLIWIFWGITLMLGGPKDPRVLIQLGAQLPGLEQPWRLGSYAFLHGSWEHIGMNTFVLYQLGPTIERILGTPRFLLLYTTSAILGGLASALTLDGSSVGASGALWGILGCEAAMAFLPNPILPQAIAQKTRSGIVKNLLLNAAISFFPGVNAAAHFGGGIAGFLLTAMIFVPTWHPQPRPALKAIALLTTLIFLSTGLIGLSGVL